MVIEKFLDSRFFFFYYNSNQTEYNGTVIQFTLGKVLLFRCDAFKINSQLFSLGVNLGRNSLLRFCL